MSPAKKAAPKRAAKKAAAPASGFAHLLGGGSTVAQIPVNISYRIIELFSAGLYQSPNKAVEELVANSYDAMASAVDVVLPTSFGSSSASIWIIDDGESMDVDGLRDLWQIARSPKATSRDQADAERAVIGKFGIGKLATYILARRLTYVCRRDGVNLAVTMDYDDVDQELDDEQRIELDVRELDDTAVANALAPMRLLPGGPDIVDRLLADEGPWTAAAMTDLKPAASSIKHGRLRWILSTALPMSPKFKLHLNGKRVSSVVERSASLAKWKVGTNKDLPDGVTSGKDELGPYVEFEELSGRYRGEVEIFKDVLTKGKASEWGRSHGFFVKVRGRLVNLDDPLFGLAALSHASFNRFRMIIEADGLDDFLASTRESVKDDPKLNAFREYLKTEFYAARKRYEAWIADEEEEAHLSTRLGRTPSSLSRRPLVESVRRLVTGDVASMLLIQSPSDLDDPEGFVEELEELLEEDDGAGIIVDVVPEFLKPDNYIALYDPVTRIVKVNALHPFFANFIENLGRQEPFKLLAVAEVLTEAYLYDEGLSSDVVQRIMQRRDAFLRELVSQQREGPAVIAQNLRDQAADADGLEEAVADAFRSIGFNVTPIGGKGTPDGVAQAGLGKDADGVNGDYLLTFDAKSTGSNAVSAKTVGVSTLARHRKDYDAQYAVVVAPSFQGGESRAGALGKECVDHKVTPIDVGDLALLVEVCASRMVSLRKIRTLFESRTAKESRDWVKALMDEDAEGVPPLKELLEAIAELQKQPDSVECGTVAYLLRDKFGLTSMDKDRVRELVVALRTLAPGYVTLTGDIVTLETSVENVRKVLSTHYHDLPDDLREGYIEKSFSAPKPKKKVAKKAPSKKKSAKTTPTKVAKKSS